MLEGNEVEGTTSLDLDLFQMEISYFDAGTRVDFVDGVAWLTAGFSVEEETLHENRMFRETPAEGAKIQMDVFMCYTNVIWMCHMCRSYE